MAPVKENNHGENHTPKGASTKIPNSVVFSQIEGRRDSNRLPSGIGKKRIPSGTLREGKRDSLSNGLNFGKKSIQSTPGILLHKKDADSFAEFHENEPLSVEELKLIYPDHALLNILKNGDHFGEIALSFRSFRFQQNIFKNNMSRTATVVCKEPCHFMVLNSSAYYRILSIVLFIYLVEDFLR